MGLSLWTACLEEVELKPVFIWHHLCTSCAQRALCGPLQMGVGETGLED